MEKKGNRKDNVRLGRIRKVRKNKMGVKRTMGVERTGGGKRGKERGR